jgi:isoquinoline 1-oxidoreductase subunit beta
MNSLVDRQDFEPSRRQFMIGAGGLTFAFALGTTVVHAAAVVDAEATGKQLTPWVSIAPDDTITIMSPATEMGQGSMTSLPRILAEELDADWDKIEILPAPVIEKFYGNSGFGGDMKTAQSNAVTDYFTNLRTFGAQVRRILIDNAAKKWGVPPSELTTEPSVVIHANSGQRLSYGEIAAFAEVPEEQPEIRAQDLKRPEDFRLIGKNTLRVELPLKVNGSAKYSIDVQLPGMLYGTVVRTPVEGGAVETIDDAKAKMVPGVVKIVPLPYTVYTAEPAGPAQGLYGVGVVAETPWAAFEAKEHLARGITWKHSGSGWGFDSEKTIGTFARDVADLSMAGTVWYRQGDGGSALAGATAVLEAAYRCDYAYHAQMEPLNCTASVAPGGKSAEIWVGTQSQTMSVESAARDLGISRDEVKLHDMLLGGAFGRRGHRQQEFITDALLLSREAQRPVKMMWTREDDVKAGRMRPMTAHFVRGGLDASGKLVDWHHRIAGDRVAPFFDPVLFAHLNHRDDLLMAGVEVKSYDIPNQAAELLSRDTGMRTSPLRGISFTANKFVTEAFFDEIAQKRAIDPVAMRLALLKNTPRGRKVVERVAEMADWSKPRDGHGLGIAFVDYSSTLLAGIAEVSVDHVSGKINVHNFWCSIDCGIAVHPDNVIAQCEGSIVYGLGLALSERITYTDGNVDQSNFHDYIVPRMSDVPAMHIDIVSTNEHPTGVGQMATPLVAPAIANAVARLTGVRLREAPMTPDRVRKSLG